MKRIDLLGKQQAMLKETRYVRKGLVPKVKKMTERHKKVRTLIQKLSKVNWELLKLESKQ